MALIVLNIVLLVFCQFMVNATDSELLKCSGVDQERVFYTDTGGLIFLSVYALHLALTSNALPVIVNQALIISGNSD